MNTPLISHSSPSEDGNKLPIGVFDSGVGGLSVLDKLVAAFPEERFVYFGDTLHMPYGVKSYDAIAALAHGSIRWLDEVHRVRLIVIACNTSAVILNYQRRPDTEVPLVGTMIPVCEWIATQSSFKRVGVIATPFTVKARGYGALLEAANPSIEVQEIACPELAACIEQGEADSKETRARLQDYLAPLMVWEPDALILGCTHYPFARQAIAQVLGDSIPLLDPADHIARRVGTALGRAPVLGGKRRASVEYYVSAEPERFVRVCRNLPLENLCVDTPGQVEVNPPVLRPTP